MNRVVNFEYSSPEPEKTVEFFSKVFGWNVSQWEGEWEYWLATTGKDGTPGINGGILRSQDGQPRTVNTIEVASVDEYAEKVAQHGGQVVVPKMAIPGVGYLMYFTDPGGVMCGIMHSDPEAK